MGKLATFDLIAAVGDVDAVTAIIDPEAIATVAHVQQMIADHNSDPQRPRGSLGGRWRCGRGSKSRFPPLAGPSSADLEDAEDIVEGELYLDLHVEEAVEGLIPQVMLHKVAPEYSKGSRMSTSSRVLDGAVRFWVQQAPTEDMAATLVLLSADGGISGGGGTYVLPVATKDRLGGVKLGDGFSTTPDGTLSYEGSGLPDEAIVTTATRSRCLTRCSRPRKTNRKTRNRRRPKYGL